MPRLTPASPWRRRLAIALAAIALTACVLIAALWLMLRAALIPQAGEWAAPIGRGPLALRASVPQLVWLATTPWIGERLHGVRLRTRAGPVTLGWVPPGEEGPRGVLTVHCEPCTLSLPAPMASAVGQAALHLPAAQIALSREITDVNGQHLRGTLLLGTAAPTGERGLLTARWQAQRHGPGWQVDMQWPDAPARHWFALLAPGLPELAVAHIEGDVAARATWHLPHGPLHITPQVQGLAVSGLGTGQWAHARSSCGPHRLHPARGWLARAVLAAEDQRFHQHPGYDLPELVAALQLNQQHGAIQRGGSTLNQQVAKLMVAGGERTLARKLRELLYAVEMEHTLGKARILQLYLNLAPWGHQADGQLICGADAAARHYFGTRAARLTPRQAVTLAAMLRQPAHDLTRPADATPERVRWVAQQVRGVPLHQRRALMAQLDAPPGP